MTNDIRVYRARFRVSQMIVARRARLSQTIVSLIEVGKREPTPMEMRRIAKALRADVAEVFPPQEQRCDHKFVDSNHCLKCGWEPRPAEALS